MNEPLPRIQIVVCKGPVCGDRRGSAALTAHLAFRRATPGFADRVAISEEVCLGHCLRGPNVLVVPDGADGALDPRTVLYNQMTVEDLDRVVDRHLGGGLAIRPLPSRPPTGR